MCHFASLMCYTQAATSRPCIHQRVIFKTFKVERNVFCHRSGLPSIFSSGKGSLETEGERQMEGNKMWLNTSYL